MKGKWQTWNISDAEGRALVVGEGTQKECEEHAARGNASAEKHDVPIRFEALPESAKPEFWL